MRIGVIGTGNMGAAFARRLDAAGHDVAIACRHREHGEHVAASVAGRVKAADLGALAAQSDLLIAATPYEQQVEAIRASGATNGTVVVDISNPLRADYSGLTIGFSTSAGEEIARALPGIKVVKAFNTLFAALLSGGTARQGEGKIQVFYAGDDAAAKETVRGLIDSMKFEAFDTGPLANARYLEPLCMFGIYLAYGVGMGTSISPVWKRFAVQPEATHL